jgi:ribonuclease-3
VLHYSFRDLSLLDLALTHRSAAKANNERLEYLGDSFLSYAIARRLYERRPGDSEGELSRARAALVREATLAEIGRVLAVDTQVVLGSGELRSGGAQRSAMLADAVEALIGAVLLDGGAEAAEALIDRLFGEQLASLPAAASLKDAKTKLQEWLQGHGLKLPTYIVETVTGRDHAQTFHVTCSVPERGAQSRGSGTSRRVAEQRAAEAMLAVLAGDPD